VSECDREALKEEAMTLRRAEDPQQQTKEKYVNSCEGLFKTKVP